MGQASSSSDNHEVLSGDVAALRQEVAQLHGEMHGAMRQLAAILASLKDIRGFEEEASAHLAALQARERRLTAIPTRCHACGAQVTRHPAEAGELLLCPVCGWSTFIDHHGHEENEVTPAEAPAGAAPGSWAI